MRRGRDSIRLRLIPRAENSVRHATSQPGERSPPPQKTSVVLEPAGPGEAAGVAAAVEAAGSGASPTQANRVALSGSSSIPSARTVAPYSRAAWRGADAGCGGAPGPRPPPPPPPP